MRLLSQESGEYLIQGIEPGIHYLFFEEYVSEVSFMRLCAAIRGECDQLGLIITEASLTANGNQRSSVAFYIETRESNK